MALARTISLERQVWNSKKERVDEKSRRQEGGWESRHWLWRGRKGWWPEGFREAVKYDYGQ